MPTALELKTEIDSLTRVVNEQMRIIHDKVNALKSLVQIQDDTNINMDNTFTHPTQDTNASESQQGDEPISAAAAHGQDSPLDAYRCCVCFDISAHHYTCCNTHNVCVVCMPLLVKRCCPLCREGRMRFDRAKSVSALEVRLPYEEDGTKQSITISEHQNKMTGIFMWNVLYNNIDLVGEYVGDTCEGKPHGYGTLAGGHAMQWHIRFKYVGKWKYGMFHGKGVLYLRYEIPETKSLLLPDTHDMVINEDMYRYSDIREYLGYVYCVVSTYEGDWEHGEPHGFGTWVSRFMGIYPNHNLFSESDHIIYQKYVGSWDHNRRKGECKWVCGGVDQIRCNSMKEPESFATPEDSLSFLETNILESDVKYNRCSYDGEWPLSDEHSAPIPMKLIQIEDYINANHLY